jgi:hypothetical protein
MSLLAAPLMQRCEVQRKVVVFAAELANMTLRSWTPFELVQRDHGDD